ncbi:hypothetical protein FN846DRAFT_358362 [Sphaerosporella brunnea]|uniref:J domain-containing protein n=1 Tax=Sphaerosporella brunnea TaxID=1250544 RepID=A0A5J5F6D2_9PEZI|nr:hypothetical protein FN846DRAFT_358362 [Sphaerosporella brunnea]
MHHLAPCFYCILGALPAGHPRDIRAAYLSQARGIHPDKHPAEENGKYTAFFQQLQEAYATLRDEDKRRIYEIRSGFFGTRGALWNSEHEKVKRPWPERHGDNNHNDKEKKKYTALQERERREAAKRRELYEKLWKNANAEAETKRKEDEARKQEEEAKKRDEEVKRQEEEARQRKELARQREEEEVRQREEEEARQLEEREARQREEEEARQREEREARQREEEEARQLEEREARQREEEEARQREEKRKRRKVREKAAAEAARKLQKDLLEQMRKQTAEYERLYRKMCKQMAKERKATDMLHERLRKVEEAQEKEAKERNVYDSDDDVEPYTLPDEGRSRYRTENRRNPHVYNYQYSGFGDYDDDGADLYTWSIPQYSSGARWTPEETDYMLSTRKKGYTWSQVAGFVNRKFGTGRSESACSSKSYAMRQFQ